MLEFKHPDMLVGLIIILPAAIFAIFLTRTRKTLWKIYSIMLPMLAAALALLAAAKPVINIHPTAQRVIVALDDSPAAITAPWHDSQWLRKFLQKHIPPHVHITLVKFASRPHIVAASLLPGTIPAVPLGPTTGRALPASTKRLLEYTGTTPCWIFTTGLLRWQLPGNTPMPVAPVAVTVVPPTQTDVGITNIHVVYHQIMAERPAGGQPLRGRAKITSHFPAGSFGRGLRCSLLTDPRAGYARRSRLASGQNSHAVKYEFTFARPLTATPQLQVTLRSTGSITAILVESAGARVLYKTRVRFAHYGSKLVLLPPLALPAGQHQSAITVAIEDHDPWPGDNQARIEIPELNKPHALIITRHPATDTVSVSGWITEELRPSQLSYSLNTLGHFQAVVLDNIPRSNLFSDIENQLSMYVNKTGGGLLIMGVQHAFGPGGYGLPQTHTDNPSAIEQLSPLSCLPPRPKPLHIVFLLDGSGSMGNITTSGRTRFGLAAHGICTAVELLGLQDHIAILLFSGTTRLLISGTVNAVRPILPALLSRIAPTGPTRPNSALPLLRKLLTRRALLVLVTDGRIPHLQVSAWQRLLLHREARLTIVAPRQSSPAVEKLLTTTRAVHFVSRHFGQWADFLRTAVARKINGRPHHYDQPWISKPFHLQGITRQWDRVYLKPEATLMAQGFRYPLAAVWRRGLGKVAAMAFSAGGKAAGILCGNLLNMVRAPAGNNHFEITTHLKHTHWQIQVQAMKHGNFLNHQRLGLTIVRRHNKIFNIPLPQIGPGLYFNRLPQRLGAYSATVWVITGKGKQRHKTFVGRVNVPQLPNRYFPATGHPKPCPWPAAEVIPVTTANIHIWQPTVIGDMFSLSGLLWALAALAALAGIILAYTV
jgi:hypothetical protein